MWNTKNEIGNRYGRLQVIEKAPNYIRNDGRQYASWLCRCDCGTDVVVPGFMLRSGKRQSCGCLRKETVSQLHKRHGETNTRLYMLWQSMKNRCLHPSQQNYKYYGEKGIYVCESWNAYENFREWAYANGYNDTLTIDRIDENKCYCPENCRWVTFNANRSRAVSRKITVNGDTMNQKEWAARIGVSRQTLRRWEAKGFEHLQRKIAERL